MDTMPCIAPAPRLHLPPLTIEGVEEDPAATAAPGMTAGRTRWRVDGRDFDVFTWSEAVYRRMSRLDRAVMRAARARVHADGSWHLLLSAG